MSKANQTIQVLLEIGKKKTIASALDWPGWCRIGKDEETALQAVAAYGPRYAHVIDSTGLDFTIPGDISQFQVVERVQGTATTDFGVPEAITKGESDPVDGKKLERLKAILQASWQSFDKAVDSAKGKELTKGPRGGGRDLDKIIEHVVLSSAGYISRLGRKTGNVESMEPGLARTFVQEAMIDALGASVRGELPKEGPRGGKIWPVGYFVRRQVWHILDHVWEIEDRIVT